MANSLHSSKHNTVPKRTASDTPWKSSGGDGSTRQFQGVWDETFAQVVRESLMPVRLLAFVVVVVVPCLLEILVSILVSFVFFPAIAVRCETDSSEILPLTFLKTSLVGSRFEKATIATTKDCYRIGRVEESFSGIDKA
jgi:hypothetical protein